MKLFPSSFLFTIKSGILSEVDLREQCQGHFFCTVSLMALLTTLIKLERGIRSFSDWTSVVTFFCTWLWPPNNKTNEFEEHVIINGYELYFKTGRVSDGHHERWSRCQRKDQNCGSTVIAS